MSEYLDLGNGFWANKEELNAINKAGREAWFKPARALTEEEKYESHLKYAYVTIEDKRTLVFCHNENGKIYACEEDCPALKKPLIEITSPHVFERWCSSMDI